MLIRVARFSSSQGGAALDVCHDRPLLKMLFETASSTFRLPRQILHSLTTAGGQQIGREGKATAGVRATTLLQSLEQAVSCAPLDPIARHFLRPILAPAFKVKILDYPVLLNLCDIFECLLAEKIPGRFYARVSYEQCQT